MPVVQVRFGSSSAEWHRLMYDHSLAEERLTACEKVIPDTYRASREPNYEEPLCRDGCFSPGELRIAKKLADAQRTKKRESAEAFEAESEARAVEREDSRRIQRERLEHATGEHRPITVDEDDP